MIPLFWGLIRFACVRPDSAKRNFTIRGSLFALIGLPVTLFIFIQIVSRLARENFAYSIFIYIFISLVVLTGVIVLGALIRLFVFWLLKVDTWSTGGQLAFIATFALVMPWAGLLLNQTIPFPNDFQSWEVYALATANAIFLGLASWLRDRLPGLSLGLLCSTLPFSLYFFFVFLPFLPLAPLAIIAVGTGFLILTPTVLTVVHLVLLNRARKITGLRSAAIGVLCFLLLPGFFTLRGLADRSALNTALDYLYTPKVTDQPRQYEANLLNLRRAIDNHLNYKNGIYYPLLSDYYAWLVFDNLVLPDDKIAELQLGFFGQVDDPELDSLRRGNGRLSRDVRRRNAMPRSAPAPRTVEVADFDLNSIPTATGTTKLTLQLTLENTGPQPAEFSHALPLPPGSFITGFRLQVAGEFVAGRIFEKKTALWVYTMIRDIERRDPGILYFNSHDELELRVFPVAPSTPSLVEIDFLVPAAIDSTPDVDSFDGMVRELQQLMQAGSLHSFSDNKGSVVINGFAQNQLPPVTRPSFIHLIIDRSEKNGFSGDLSAARASLAQHFPNSPISRITLANFDTVACPLDSSDLELLPLQGGLLTDYALAQAIRQHRDLDLDSPQQNGLPARPIFVLLGQRPSTLPTDLDLTQAWQSTLPYLEVHSLDASGHLARLTSNAPNGTPVLKLGTSVRPLVPGHPIRFNSDSTPAALQYWNPDPGIWQSVGGIDRTPTDSIWAQAVALTLGQQDYDRGIDTSPAALKSLISTSKRTGVLIESGSYIVVESAAQWRMLEKSEQQKLDQNEALDFRETPIPSTSWLIAGFGLWLLARRRRPLSRLGTV